MFGNISFSKISKRKLRTINNTFIQILFFGCKFDARVTTLNKIRGGLKRRGWSIDSFQRIRRGQFIKVVGIVIKGCCNAC